ncbi:PMS1 [Candida pseudojiufengensis]|uniref:PMS1 n=1 Tax=Candida pseudojiufengensis TaxID=497109 RepID=UPI002224EED1|nr:PMS1 [Candida pseudojiufengensis]KAI5966940.1 PMS1 [Candida pseudojiufengensis]
MTTIQTISAKDISKITSGQVIIDLRSIVKELIENAIDANATRIVINFINYGVDLIGVSDNGKGINKEDFATVCLRSHTSKINEFEDLSTLTTLGFRGEALNSICALSNKVTITTQTLETYPKNYTLNYDQLGQLIKETSKIGGMSNKSGTSITVEELFKCLPVRWKNFVKTSKREFHKTINFIINYLIIYPNIKFEVTNNNNGKKQLVLSSKGGENNTITETLISIFGSNGNTNLLDLDLKINEDMTLSGHISSYSFGLGRSTPDRQFLYINKRPINFKKLSMLINEVYKSFNHVQFPVYVINIDINPELIDVNLIPDKTNILIHREDQVLELIREKLVEFYDTRDNVIIPKSTRSSVSESLKIIDGDEEGEESKEEEKEEERLTEKLQSSLSKYIQKDLTIKNEEDLVGSQTLIEEDDSESNAGMKDREIVNEMEEKEPKVSDDQNAEETELSQKDETTETEKNKTLFVEDDEDDEVEVDEHENSGDFKTIDNSGKVETNIIEDMNKSTQPIEDEVVENSYIENESSSPQTQDFSDPINQNGSTQSNIYNTDNTEDEPFIKSQSISSFKYDEEEDILESNNIKDQHGVNFFPVIETMEDEPIKMIIDDEEFEERPTKRFKRDINLFSKKIIESSENILSNLTTIKQYDQTFENSQETSVNKNLEDKEIYHISKSDFLQMKLIGQFNLGFILVSYNSNLFIIDQHASDEKYNFEKLIQNYSINFQPLIKPQILELNIIDEMLVQDHEFIFLNNGFKIKINNDLKPGSKISLISLPVYKNIMFDINDFYELITLINEQPSNKNIKCSKIRKILAMKACRSSIMIGSSLRRDKMKEIIGNLSKLDKPWNCPHGRPTMRHLIESNNWSSKYTDYCI